MLLVRCLYSQGFFLRCFALIIERKCLLVCVYVGVFERAYCIFFYGLYSLLLMCFQI